MRHLDCFALSLAIVSVLVGMSPGQSQRKPDNTSSNDKRAVPSIVDGWHADSVSTLLDDGNRKTLAGEGGLANVVISEKTFTMRAADKILAEMSYTLDTTQDPPTIDLKSNDGAMLGVYKLDANRLKIALNDASQGRPKNIDRGPHGLLLLLRRVEGGPLWTINADGTGLRPFFWAPEYTNCGTAAWSPDGSAVAVDSIRELFGEYYPQNHILVVDVASGAYKDLGPGVMPSWSPDGKRMAFTSPNDPSHRGACIMNADGSEIRQIDPDASWVKWSPKGDELAFIIGGQGGENLGIYDLKTKQRRTLLDREYRQLGYGFNWSPDGEWICYKGTASHGDEVAVVHREGQKKGFRFVIPDPAALGIIDINYSLAWEPKVGKRILASLATHENRIHQLYMLDPEGKTPPQLLAGQDPEQSCMRPSWSPDGKRIVFRMLTGSRAQAGQ